MKRNRLFVLVICFFIIISCSKNSSSSSGSSVQYQVTATNSSAQMIIAYNNSLGQLISGNYKSGWTSSFTPAQKPFTASLQASIYPINGIDSTTVTLKILVNGAVVQSVTQPISVTSIALAQIQYTLQ